MTMKQLKEGLAILSQAGLANSPSFNEEKKKMWYLFFQLVDYNLFISSILIYISKNTFFPTIAGILAIIEQNQESKYELPESIWQIFLEQKRDAPELIKKAFRIAGISLRYMNECTSDTSQRYLRPKVEKIYRQLIEKEDNVKLITNIEKITHNLIERKL